MPMTDAAIELTANPTPPARPPSPQFFGCFMAMVAAGGVMVLIAIAALIWFFIPEDGVPVAVLLGPETEGVIHLEADRDDPGIDALMHLVIEELQYKQRADTLLPSALRSMQRM